MCRAFAYFDCRSQDTVTWNSGANTTATLSLVDLNTSGGFSDFALDDLKFNAVGVPEPGTLAVLGTALGGLGGLAGLGGWRMRRNARKPSA